MTDYRTITEAQFLELEFNGSSKRGFGEEVAIMQMGNASRYVVDKSFSQASPGKNESRYWKRLIHKAERRTARMDLRRGGEIRLIRPVTGNEII